MKLVKPKGVYPHEYMKSFKKFFEDKLPDKYTFLVLSKTHELVKKIIYMLIMFGTMGDYDDLHLKTDVLLLADVFENFIKICLDYYGLDHCHCFSSPVLSWDAMLKMTGTELNLISDTTMYLFIEKGMRGVISYIAKKHSKTNNKHMKCHDSSK